MKIIQIIYSLCSGGAEKFVVDLSNQLATMGHEVTLCMLLDDTTDERLTFNKQFLNNAVNFHSMKFEPGFSICKVNKVEKYIRAESPDIVHCHLNVIPYVYGLSIFNNNIKVFHTLHSVAEKASCIKIQRLINRFFYKYKIIKPICISKLCLQSYQHFYKLNNAFLIDNGRAMISASSYYQQVKQEVESYKRTPNSIVYIHVARYNILKNQAL